MKASTVVITHTVVWIRPTGTPSVAARSERSATARIAMPDPRVPDEAAPAPPSTRGTTMNTIRSLSSKIDAADLDLDVERGVQLRAGRCP